MFVHAQMESSHPEAVAEMMSHAAGMFVVGPDGKACSARFGRPKWQPRVASAQLTETFPEGNWGSPSAAAFCCATADVWTLFSQPYCAGVSYGNLILAARHRQPRYTPLLKDICGVVA